MCVCIYIPSSQAGRFPDQPGLLHVYSLDPMYKKKYITYNISIAKVTQTPAWFTACQWSIPCTRSVCQHRKSDTNASLVFRMSTVYTPCTRSIDQHRKKWLHHVHASLIFHLSTIYTPCTRSIYQHKKREREKKWLPCQPGLPHVYSLALVHKDVSVVQEAPPRPAWFCASTV